MKPNGWDLAAWGFALYVGSSLLTALSAAFSALALVGLILFLIGLYQIGQATGAMEVFTDQLIGRLILWLGLFLVLVVFGGLALVGMLAGDGDAGTGFALGTLVLGFLAFWLVNAVAAWFIRRSFKRLGEVSRRPLFGLAGDLILWGAIATILLVGFLVLLAGEIVALVAFFSASEEAA